MDLNTLTPSDLAALKAKLFPETDPLGRSPLRPRQLHNLTLLPTKDDPRPTFFWSVEGPRDVVITHTAFPKLLWHQTTNTEVTVYSQDEEAHLLATGYGSAPISAVVLDPVQNLADQLAGLSEEEQALILQAQQQTRIETLTAKLSKLSDADLERLLSSVEPAKKRGRPSKVA